MASGCGLLLAGATVPGCTGRFDWREAHLPGDEIRMLLPARSTTLTRRIHLRAEAVEMTMVGADADDLAFTVAVARSGGDSPAVGQGSAADRLASMREQMLRNIAAPVDTPPRRPQPIPVIDGAGRSKGARDAVAVDARGTGAHAAVRLQGRFFTARGLAAQAVVIGRAFDDEAARRFFESLRIVEP
ncbi:MAG: hypothetical protein ABWZ78_11050 [Burkholderiaceae bacterium]